MNLLLQRFSSGSDSTLGALFGLADGKRSFRCFTLEDERREVKVPGETRIPAGKYQIKLRTEGSMHAKYSQRYTWHMGMLWLQDVPGFEWIYIHPGNDDDDTEGCILVGDGSRSNVQGQGGLTSSLAAYERLYKHLSMTMQAGKEVWIQIEDYA